jgi:predicted nucleotidyltransferase
MSSMAQTRHSIDDLRSIVAPVAERYGIGKVYLFGSVARGDYNDESDYDFCIERGTMRGLIEMSEFFQDLRDAVGSEIDLIDSKYADSELLDRIISEGIVVYEE